MKNLISQNPFRFMFFQPAFAVLPLRTPMLQTRHTFATLMIDAGEDIGWVQKMLGHGSLQMIYIKYYSWIKRDTRNDGSAFVKKMIAKNLKKNLRLKFDPKLTPICLITKKGLTPCSM